MADVSVEKALGVKLSMPYQWQIRYKGICDYAGLLRLVNDWLAAKGYEVHNAKDKHKMRPDGSETEYVITGWRNLTEFIRWTVRVDIWGWEEVDVEVIKDGKKQVLQKMRLWIRINGDLVLDYGGRFEKSRFSLALRKFLIGKVLAHRVDSFEGDMLHYKLLDLQTAIKTFLGLSTLGNEFADMW